MIAALGAAQNKGFLKNLSPQATGAYTTLFPNSIAPGFPGGAAASSSGAAGDVPTSSTSGAFSFTNPTAGLTSYLCAFDGYATVAGTLLLFDRLWQNSGLSPTLLTAQTVNSVALTRPDANGGDVEAWLEVVTALGAGSTAPSISYTNQAGTSGKTATLQQFVASAGAGRTFRFALAAGDTGVRSIQSYTNGATMTSGTFSLVLRRRIAAIPVSLANLAATLDAIQLGMPVIYDNACLELVWLATQAGATQVGGMIGIGQG